MMSSVGFTDLMWFMGTVEEVAGGTGLAGRVRVRAQGIHPPLDWKPEPKGFGGDELPDVPTEALPWAPVVGGGGSAKMPGVGEWVFGFFVDGRDAQHPVVMGILPGFNTTLPMGSGTQYDSPGTARFQENIDNFGEPSVSAPEAWAGTGNNAETAAHQSIRPAAMSTGDGRDVLELAPEFGGDPDRLSVVQASTHGSSIQVGGNKTSEHVSMVHESGSHIQIDQKGNVKVGTGESLQQVAANIQQYADGSFDIMAGENLTVHVAGGKATFKVEGDIDFVSGGNISFTAAQKILMNAGESVFVRGSQVNLESVVGNINALSSKKIKISAGTGASIRSETLEVLTTGSTQFAAGGRFNASGSDVGIYGATVYLDDVVRMSEGGSSEVASASEPAAYVSNDTMPQPRAVAFLSPTKTTGGASGGISSFAQVDDGNVDTTPQQQSRSAPPVNTVGRNDLENDPEFQAKLAEMMEKYPTLTKEEIYRVIQGESRFSTTALNSNSQAAGFFQFTPDAARELGYSTDDVLAMSATEQLGVYDQYLDRWSYAGSGLGIMQAAPAYANRSDSFEVYSPSTKAYTQNPGWIGGDGKITVGSINDYYRKQG